MAEFAARDFMNRAQKSILEAPSVDAALAYFPKLFEPDAFLLFNGQRLDMNWLQEHVREVFRRLKNIKVEVTHAGREGMHLCERHVVTANYRDTGGELEIEIMAAYNLSEADRIRSWHELSRTCRGEYTGW